MPYDFVTKSQLRQINIENWLNDKLAVESLVYLIHKQTKKRLKDE